MVEVVEAVVLEQPAVMEVVMDLEAKVQMVYKIIIVQALMSGTLVVAVEQIIVLILDVLAVKVVVDEARQLVMVTNKNQVPLILEVAAVVVVLQ